MISPTTWRITTTVLAGIAQLFTIIRIIYRYKKSCCWLDDVVGALASACSLAALVAFWFYSNGVDEITHLKVDLTTAYWAFSVMNISVIWLSRIGLSLTLIRISPLDFRRLSYVTSVLLAMMGIALIAQRAVLCQLDSSWKSIADPQCNNTVTLATTISSEFSSSLIMLFGIARTYAFSDNIRAARRGMFIALFIANCFLFAGSISHTVFLIQGQGDPEDLLERFTFTVQSSVSLMFTNLPTTIAAVYLSFDKTIDDPEAQSHGGATSTHNFKQNLLARNISLPRPITFFASRESFFSNEKSASTVKHGSSPLAVPPMAYKSNVRSSKMSKSSAGSASSSYSTDSTYQRKVVDHKPDPTFDLASIDRSNCSVSSVYTQDTLSTNPLVNSSLRSTASPSHRYHHHHHNGSGYTTEPHPSRTDPKMVRFLSKLVSDEHHASVSGSRDGSRGRGSEGSKYSSYFMDNHPSLYIQSARSSEVLDYEDLGRDSK
ncbi:hypothetical protein K435DRAFT_857928 [Dendrothele bispora CBS 962.96]|uniref:G-protein coupled receptors family 3 profile domain-containing protein n=1 Tax=Dendrothele bispora (strain CBS 962.96) TaxID=1314807 RepID=A0A4S8M4K4_DENBC|nr:hypothetical protein K435DRAFT_857928 [Dendrothele bispora CBS 962.96]